MTKLTLSFFLVFLPITVISHSLNSQRSTLLSLKQQWSNPQNLSSWNPATSPCSWYGIQCSAAADNSTEATVTGISLYKAGINFKIPPFICELKSLKFVNLSWNNIPGGFPTALRSCAVLTHLDLSSNLFVGPIPDDVDKLLPASLEYLNLMGNNFTGNIPKSIAGLKELKTLYVSSNLLNGTYPSEISNLSKLEDLQLDNNPFIPMLLPSEWGKLKNMKILIMNRCNLVGPIPDSFGGLVSLEQLDLSENGLVGRILDGLFFLKGLKYLHLNNNKLSGEIPSEVQSLNLTVLDLKYNTLSGSIPEAFGNLKKLKDLKLVFNNLSGEIPATIGLLPELEILQLFNNNLSGPLPPELGLHSRFLVFEIGHNQFSGPLPENLCSRGALIGITAFSNNLSGEVPKSLGNCSTLRTLMIYNNSFTGAIPSGVWTLPDLYDLMLNFNGFTGSLPNRIAQSLTILYLNNNNFNGQIPETVATWTNIQEFLAGNNKLSGTFPLGLARLAKLEILSLEGNQLSGGLPLSINYSWDSLNTLKLARNKFCGPIPGTIGSLRTLDNLDLSSNFFSGEIPTQFEKLKFSFLNLSNNKLLGEIPYSLDNEAFANSFLNNTNLCTSDNSQILTLPRCSTSLRSFSSSHLSSKHLAMILVLAVILFSVTLYFSVFVIKESKRKRMHKDELTSWKFTQFYTLQFTEVDIISSLSEHQVIGSGGSGKVYHVPVDNLGYSVAVKRIWNNHKLDNAQFLAEVQILGDIRHANIVKLLCCISSEKSKLLVYEYMENQSLDRWLHKRRRLESESRGEPVHVLDWPTRMRIAIGAAQGLSYMHHDCASPIIHRDVKSSNILLDSEFNAKIADFGLAKMIKIKQGELHTMSKIAGSFGYLAPEYRYTTKVNEKVDVYSYGVVLLELATGKEPNGEDESLNLAEWCWRHWGENKPIVEVIDKEVTQEEYIEEMIVVFKLGLMCTTPLPNTRPSIKEVLQMLLQRNRFKDDSRRLKTIGNNHVIDFDV